ncbi:MAG: ATP-dependent Clp protease adapter ClpS [Betaproteobacteria bacterium]|nr:ATP-dependent Clp protease adapter ClpS [Betaproteobacteria bacterium]
MHGKGLGSPGKTPVLKAKVQRWLVQKNEVLAFVQAKGPEGGAGALVVERQTARVKPPSPFQVVMLNDDYTPMEFVIHVLQQHFHHDLETATMIMLKIHHEGRGVCGVYPKDVAATKVELVLAAARRHQHPLQCIMEAS